MIAFSDSPDPSTPAPPLDIDTLARLRATLDPDDRQGVVVRVLAAYRSALERLLVDLDGADAARLERLAHTLKSSSASVGALALAAACAEVEARLRAATPPPQRMADDVAMLRRHAEAALAAVVAMLSK